PEPLESGVRADADTVRADTSRRARLQRTARCRGGEREPRLHPAARIFLMDPFWGYEPECASISRRCAAVSSRPVASSTVRQLVRCMASATAAQAFTDVNAPAGVVNCRELWVRICSTLGPASRLPSASRRATIPVTSAVARELPEAKS